MVGKYKAYPEYKDSGVEWLSNIPNHWEIFRIKHLSLVKRGASPRPIDDPKYFDDNGEYAWARIADVSASGIYLEKTAQKTSTLGSSLSVKLEPGELFLSIAATVGKPCITAIKTCIHDGFVYFPTLKIPNKFLFYIFAAEQAYKGLGKFGTQLNLNTDTVGDIKVAIPELREFSFLTKFLDHETAKIDTLIEKQQQLIKLLEEKRQAVISHAVTKGLNPNVSMKDSGVEWLGEIPEYWEIYRLKTITTLKTSKSCFKNNLIALENIESWSGKYVKTENDYSGDGIAFKAGDILFGKLRPYLAKVYIAESDGEAIGDFFVLRTKPKVISRFLQLCLLTQEVIFIINGSTFGAKMPRVSWEFMGNLSFVIPPLKEQEEIISYLKAEISKLDLLIEKANQTIILLKERRTALISAAVTGKIDVRDWQAPTITV